MDKKNILCKSIDIYFSFLCKTCLIKWDFLGVKPLILAEMKLESYYNELYGIVCGCSGDAIKTNWVC